MKKYEVLTTNNFEKDVKRCMKRGYDISLLYEAVELLAANGSLPAKYKPHKLVGDHQGIWECHIRPNWLLVWQQNDMEFVLLFTDTGTHADIFG